MTPLYPVAEFRTVSRRAIRRWLFTTLFAVGTVVLFTFTALHWSEPWAVHDPAPALLWLWGTLASAAGTLVCEVLQKAAAHPLTRCPHCRGKLSEYVPLVVAGGCCPYCGVRVLEPPADTPADSLIPRADYLAEDARHQQKVAPVIVFGVFACYVGGFAALGVLSRFRMPDPLPGVVFVALVAVAPVCMIVVLRWLNAAGKRNPSIACPSCGKILGGRMLVASTGNCSDCGCPAVMPRARPLAPPHLAPLWQVSRLRELGNRRKRWVWRLAVRVGLIAGVTVGLVVVGKVLWSADWLQALGVGRVPALLAEEFGALAVGVLGGVVGVVVLRRTLRTARRRHPMDCPRCGRELSAPFATATKCCHQCGRPAVR